MVCGAECTEPTYFHALKRSLQNPAVTVKAKKGAPRKLVEYARDIASNSEDDFDEVWCVVDTDNFNIESAAATAKKLSVRLAISNPCFELWLLLHCEDWKAFLRDANAAEFQLRKRVTGYKKNDLRFADFEFGVPAALDRAKKLDPTGLNYSVNPSSSVWVLVQLIEEGGRRS